MQTICVMLVSPISSKMGCPYFDYLYRSVMFLLHLRFDTGPNISLSAACATTFAHLKLIQSGSFTHALKFIIAVYVGAPSSSAQFLLAAVARAVRAIPLFCSTLCIIVHERSNLARSTVLQLPVTDLEPCAR